METIEINGIRYATPEKFIVRQGTLYGLFPGQEDDPTSFDRWQYWGLATEENIEAIRRAGVPVQRWDTRLPSL